MTGGGAPVPPVREDAGRAATPGAEGPDVRVTEYTDPACPWAWGSEPALRMLRHALGARASWRRVYGILFDEDDDPAPDEQAETRWYERYVQQVAAHTGAPYTLPLRRVARTSWPASLAARAAEAQGPEVADAVLRRLREAMFLLGAPVDEPEAVRGALQGVPGADLDRLVADAASPRVRARVREDWRETRSPRRDLPGLPGSHPDGAGSAGTQRAAGPHDGALKQHNGHERYALPTVLLDGPGGTVCVPGRRPFEAYWEAAASVAGGPLPEIRTTPPDEALRRWRSLTLPELALLAGESAPAPRAVRVDTANGPVWLHPNEARVHPAAGRSPRTRR